MIDGIVKRVLVKVDAMPSELKRVLAYEAAYLRVVVSGAVEVETGGVVFTAGILQWIR
jgi:hypothetical protein